MYKIKPIAALLIILNLIACNGSGSNGGEEEKQGAIPTQKFDFATQ